MNREGFLPGRKSNSNSPAGWVWRPARMAQPLFPGLRSRMLSAIDEGMSCRAAAARIGVAPSSAIRSHASRRDSGSFAPELQGGDIRLRRIEERRYNILALGIGRKNSYDHCLGFRRTSKGRLQSMQRKRRRYGRDGSERRDYSTVAQTLVLGLELARFV